MGSTSTSGGQLRRAPPVASPGDRFIPYRSAMDLDFANYMLTHTRKEEESVAGRFGHAYHQVLVETLLKNRTRILEFRPRPPAPPVDGIFGHDSDTLAHLPVAAKKRRYISRSPDKVLDAFGLVDDFSLNLLDWGSLNVLAIALGNSVYLRDAAGSVWDLTTVEEECGPVTSVSWGPDGRHIALGLNSSDVQLWDSVSKRLLGTLKGAHGSRVGSLSWNSHQHDVLTTGGMDGVVVSTDVRMRSAVVQTYRGHRREVCGLKWSGSGKQLASGGNDNLVHIWDLSMASRDAPRQNQWLHRFEDHTAAVKALAWCPFQHDLLASGGGDGDRCIKFWNSQTGAPLNSVVTGSLVSGLLWSNNEMELLSSHGSLLSNRLTLWKYPSMVKMADLTGHTYTVLSMARSPDGCTVASAGADGKLILWNVFGTPQIPKPAKKTGGNPGPFASYSHTHIR